MAIHERGEYRSVDFQMTASNSTVKHDASG